MAFYLLFTSIPTPLDFLPIGQTIRLARASNGETEAPHLEVPGMEYWIFLPLLAQALFHPIRCQTASLTIF